MHCICSVWDWLKYSIILVCQRTVGQILLILLVNRPVNELSVKRPWWGVLCAVYTRVLRRPYLCRDSNANSAKLAPLSSLHWYGNLCQFYHGMLRKCIHHNILLVFVYHRIAISSRRKKYTLHNGSGVECGSYSNLRWLLSATIQITVFYREKMCCGQICVQKMCCVFFSERNIFFEKIVLWDEKCKWWQIEATLHTNHYITIYLLYTMLPDVFSIRDHWRLEE